MRTSQAKVCITCNVSCPYCGKYQNRFEHLRHYFENFEQRAIVCDAEIKCIDCNKSFIVDLIKH